VDAVGAQQHVDIDAGAVGKLRLDAIAVVGQAGEAVPR
jgi:hypothetical protein